MIQLSLEFQLEKPQLPLEYERLMVSFLKAASRNYSEDMFERLYNKEHSIIKSFTFSTENCKLFLQLFLKYFYTYTIHKINL